MGELGASDASTEQSASNGRVGSLLRTLGKVTVLLLLIVVVGLAAAGLLSTDRIAIPANHVGAYAAIGGAQIRYFQTGRGPDVLLVHGLPGMIEDWKPLVDIAASRYRLTAYDRPAHGFSSANSGDYTLDRNADIALGLIDHLHLKDVIVVGSSYGGAVALAMAVRNPPKVKAFVALGSVTTLRQGQHSIFDLIRLPIIGRGIAASASRLIGPGMVQAQLERAFTPNGNLLNPEFVAARVPVVLQTKVIMAIAFESANCNDDLQKIDPGLSQISKPLQFLHGDGDQLVPLDEVKRFHERFPSMGLTVIKGTGHMIHCAHPETVLSVIDSLDK
jgi:pimeloyl-ACP methyl ester carboxylesterase